MRISRHPGIKPKQTGHRIIRSALAFQHDPKHVQRVRGLVQQLISEAENPALAVHAEISAIYHFVGHCLRYTRDPVGIELHYSPESILNWLEDTDYSKPFTEDCDGYAGMVLAMLWALGRRARLVLAGFHEKGRYKHVFVQAYQPGIRRQKIPGRWVAVDPSLGSHVRLMLSRVTTHCVLDPMARQAVKKQRGKENDRDKGS